jgi:23S rRNA (guanine2445-N2)-methyltransferase / 23S rRNA (guanine2069-N7)-methyltransferase
MQGTLDIKRDHRELINDTLTWLRRGGVLYFSTNARRFKLDHEAIDAAAIEDITAATTPEDFAAHPGHRCWRITR